MRENVSNCRHTCFSFNQDALEMVPSSSYCTSCVKQRPSVFLGPLVHMLIHPIMKLLVLFEFGLRRKQKQSEVKNDSWNVKHQNAKSE